MKIVLDIQNDEDLRQNIKQLIKGQVDGMVRVDFANLVVDELQRVIPTVNSWN